MSFPLKAKTKSNDVEKIVELYVWTRELSHLGLSESVSQSGKENLDVGFWTLGARRLAMRSAVAGRQAAGDGHTRR